MTSGHLKIHKNFKHECIRYPCDQCDHAATTDGALKRHKESKHKGIRSPVTNVNISVADPV